MAGGESFDWYYASAADRDAQIRTPIRDLAFGEDWIFRQKDLIGWWSHAHYERPQGVRREAPTAWQAKSKPIRLIEIGFPAVDKAPNAPNVFYDPKSSESAFPRYSNGQRDDLLQRKALAVAIPFWLDQPAVEQALVWAWDGRPWPDFPARDEVWSDGPNWQFGHWLNGRTGLIELRDVLTDLCSKANVSLQTSQLNGLVEGFIVDRVTTLASAMEPLSTAFEFHVREDENGLTASSYSRGLEHSLDEERVLLGSVAKSQTLLDKSPSGLALSYISGDFAYQPAVVTHTPRTKVGPFIVHSSLPLVLSERQAELIAKRSYDRLIRSAGCSLALAPSEAAGLETGDPIRFNEESWIIDRIEIEGLQTHMTLGPERAAVTRLAIDAYDAGARAVMPAAPDLYLIDGPILWEGASAGLTAAVIADPWGGPVAIEAGINQTQLRQRAVAGASANVGRLLSSCRAGHAARWDSANNVHLYMPNAAFSSADPMAVMAGENRLLVQHEDGWELIGWQFAELVGPDEWELSRLLRGLSGSPVRNLQADALCVLVTQDLVSIPVQSEEIGLEEHWRVGESAVQIFTYRNRAALPWRVGHLKADIRGEEISVSWTARGPEFSTNWGIEDPDVTLAFDVRTERAGEETLHPPQSETSISLALGSVDRIRVARIGADQRRGEWVSIPLPSP